MVAEETGLTAGRIIDELKKCGITHLVYLVDTKTRFILDAMVNQKGITLVPFCREGEGVAIAAGLVIGGKKPVMLYQNTGLYEAGDSIRTVALELRLPLLMMISYLGWRRDYQITDSAGMLLEPTLNAWGIKYYLVQSDEDVEKISIGDRQAQETNKPVAILIATEEK
jgi:sulfopyruvate decarboxylase TPP-binding subunit